MDLESLSNLGLPEWLIILAAITFIAKQVGILDYILSRFTDIREHRQATENIAIEVLKEVMREAIHERSEETSNHTQSINSLDKTVHRLSVKLDNNTLALRELAGIASEIMSIIKIEKN